MNDELIEIKVLSIETKGKVITCIAFFNANQITFRLEICCTEISSKALIEVITANPKIITDVVQDLGNWTTENIEGGKQYKLNIAKEFIFGDKIVFFIFSATITI